MPMAASATAPVPTASTPSRSKNRTRPGIDEATAGTDRAVDADNTREDEQGGNGQRIRRRESGTRVRAQRGARLAEGVILAVMSAESPVLSAPPCPSFPPIDPGKVRHRLRLSTALPMRSSWRQPVCTDPAGCRCDRRGGRGTATATIAGELRSRSPIGTASARITHGGGGSLGLIQQLFLTYVDPGDVTPWRCSRYRRHDADGRATRFGAACRRCLRSRCRRDAVTERTKLVLIATPNNRPGLR